MEGPGCAQSDVELGFACLHLADDDVESAGVDVEGRVDVGDDEAFLDALTQLMVWRSWSCGWAEGDDVDVGQGAVSDGLADVELLFGDEEVAVETQVGDG